MQNDTAIFEDSFVQYFSFLREKKAQHMCIYGPWNINYVIFVIRHKS